MIFSILSQAGMNTVVNIFCPLMAAGTDVNGFNLDLIRIIQAQSQLITVDLQLHGISHAAADPRL